ncbi:hypothetical protein BXO88_16060 [Oribacterium sp. C9]|nr:hypothetical protein BXO88_16060 [Oribacterium sp. C9]
MIISTLAGSYDYYLLKDRLDAALAPKEKKIPLEASLSIRVDEVTKGTMYYKTNMTFGTFV